jgi:hypothetical protein
MAGENLMLAKRSSKLLVVVGSVVLAAVSFLPVSLTADHSWGVYHWLRTGDEVLLNVGDNVSGAWTAYLDEAIGDWNQSARIELTAVSGGTDSRCRAVKGTIQACSGSYGNTGWLGIAQIWVNRSAHITQAITKVNDYYFNPDYAGGFYDTPAWRRLVMCQEIAHDFGLDHQDEVFDNPNLGSCMDYTNNPLGPPSNEHPNAHDFEQLELIYNHLDTSDGGGGPGGGRGQGAPGAPGKPFGDVEIDQAHGLGRLIRANGRYMVYRLDLGNGNFVVTYIIGA